MINQSSIAINRVNFFNRLMMNFENVYRTQPAKVASRSGCVTRHCWNSPAFGGLAGVNVKPWWLVKATSLRNWPPIHHDRHARPLFSVKSSLGLGKDPASLHEIGCPSLHRWCWQLWTHWKTNIARWNSALEMKLHETIKSWDFIQIRLLVSKTYVHVIYLKITFAYITP